MAGQIYDPRDMSLCNLGRGPLDNATQQISLAKLGLEIGQIAEFLVDLLKLFT